MPDPPVRLVMKFCIIHVSGMGLAWHGMLSYPFISRW